MDSGFWLQDGEILRLVIGLEEYRLEVDIAGICIEVDIRFGGASIDML